MKSLLKKDWFLGLISTGLLIVTFFLGLAVINIQLNKVFFGTSTLSILELANSSGETLYDLAIFSLVIEIAFYVGIVPLCLTIYSLFRKSSWAYYLGCIYFLAFQVLLIIFQAIYSYLPIGAIVLIILNIVLILLTFFITIFRHIIIQKNKEEQQKDPKKLEEKVEVSQKTHKVSNWTLVLDIVSVVLLFSIMIVPLYIVTSKDTITYHLLIEVLFSKSTSSSDSIFFIVNFMLFLISCIYLVSSISSFFSDKKRFMSKSKVLISYNLFSSLVFFLMGFFINFYYLSKSADSSTLSFIPMLLAAICTIVFSVFEGIFNKENHIVKEDDDNDDTESKPLRVEPLIYVFLVTAITVGSLFLTYIRVSFESSYSVLNSTVSFTGIELLKNYITLGSGYQVLAFFIFVMLVVSGLGLLLTISSYCARYQYYKRIAKVTTYLNMLFIFVFGVSGFYFTIAQEINTENITRILELYGYSYSSSIKYTITTDAIYALIPDVIILLVMMVRKSLEYNNEPIKTEITNPDELASSNGGSSSSSSPNPVEGQSQVAPTSSAMATESISQEQEEPIEEKQRDFDPCPAFTEIDAKTGEFASDLANRKKLAVSNTSLNDLVSFIVEYAKDSRLHLSYSKEDIATFLSGLGACRLTILQGMSGTGKTSLPKIFSEAIDGNCDIVEVESSWKDKNELLGYYNEFSLMYTPKKFTQALYKAALNPEIPTFIVLDEMNLSRIEYYFSDFLSLMENEEGKREIKLLNIEIEREENGQKIPYKALEEGHTIKIPSNIWFIGTANRDESTFVISDKVYDRAHTMNFNKRAPKVRDFSDPIPQRYYDYKTIDSLFSKAKKEGTFDAENNQIIKKVETLLAPYNISFGNRILNQIETFVNIYTACFPKEDVQDQAVETILLSKVVSKLEVKTVDNKDELVQEFTSLNLLKCADFISKLNED